MSIRWLWKKFSCDNASTLRRAWILLAVLAIASAAPAEPVPWQPSLAVYSFAPASGNPYGGEVIRISGRGFLAPTRVFFDMDGQSIEAAVVSMTETSVDCITPPVNLGPEQMRVATITVDSRGERATAPGAFVFENEFQTPKIFTVTPNSGPKSGGTRVTIFGEGFQQPVQVLFGNAEARVLTVTREQIIVEAPDGRELGRVGITVRNINSQTVDEIADAYRYVADAELTSVTPDHGRAGTNIVIEGVGFQAPVVVNVAGVPAFVLSVAGTRIVARLQSPSVCGSITGPVEVINVANGDIAGGLEFTYESETAPVVAAVNPRATIAGRTVTVTLESESAYTFEIGRVPATIVGRVGSTYQLRVPTSLRFRLGTCTLRGIEGLGPVESKFDLRVVDRITGCETTRRKAFTIAPAEPVPCTLPPLASVLPRTCATRTVTIANERGRADLLITAPEFVTPRTATIRGGEKKELILTPRDEFERFRFETNDPRHPWLLVCVSPK